MRFIVIMNWNLIPSLTKTLSTLIINRKISCMSYLRLKKVQKFNLYKCVESRFYCKNIHEIKEELTVCKAPDEKSKYSMEVRPIDFNSINTFSENIHKVKEKELAVCKTPEEKGEHSIEVPATDSNSTNNISEENIHEVKEEKLASWETTEEKNEFSKEVPAIDSDSSNKLSKINSWFEEELEEKNKEPKEMVTFYIENPLKGETYKITGEVGKSILAAAEEADIDVAGACGGKLGCSTCHMYLEDELMETLGEINDFMEQDLLDKAKFVKENSRLVCQVKLCKEMEGRVFTLPPGSVNFNVDGYVFKSH